MAGMSTVSILVIGDVWEADSSRPDAMRVEYNVPGPYSAGLWMCVDWREVDLIDVETQCVTRKAYDGEL